jgi:hypothetical protein
MVMTPYDVVSQWVKAPVRGYPATGSAGEAH